MKLPSLIKATISILTVFLLTSLTSVPTQAIIGSLSNQEITKWDHESITSHLKSFDPYEEGLVENDFLVEVDRKGYVYKELDYVTIEDKFLKVHSEKLLDLSSFFDTENTRVFDESSPVNIYTSIYNLVKTEGYSKDLYIFNVRWNMFTGGRDPGENYFFIVEKNTSDMNEAPEYTTTRLDFPTHHKVAHLYIDNSDTVWLDGYDFYSRYASFPRTSSIFPDKTIVKWSEIIASENLQSPSLDLNTDIRLGQRGIYLWAWPADSAENDWNTFNPLKDGTVFKYDPSQDLKAVVKVAQSGEKSKYYGSGPSNSLSPQPPRNILITEDDQIYYDTFFDGYMHFNRDRFTPYTIETGVNSDQIGKVAGAYKKENLHLVNYEGTEIDVYCVNGAYTVIVEELQNFGHTMYYDPDERLTLLNAHYDDGQKLSIPRVQDQGNIYTSDIRLFMDRKEIKGYNIGGASLVKLTDLNLSRDSYKLAYTPSGQTRRPDTDITGQVLFDKEPAQGFDSVSGQVILYGSQNSNEFYGFNEVDFEGRRIDDLTPLATSPMVYNPETQEITFAFQTSQLDDIPSYAFYFVGYKLDESSMDTSAYLSDSLENKGDLVYLSIFQKYHNDLEVKVSSRVELQGQFNFNDSIYALDHTAPRQVVFKIIKKDGSYVQDDQKLVFTGEQSDQSIPFKFDLAKNGVYEMEYTIYTYYKNDQDASVYEINALRTPDGSSRWVPIKSLLKNQDDTTITLDDIQISYRDDEYVGTAYKTDIQVRVNEDQPPALNIDGYMVTPIQTLKYLGYDLSTNFEKKIIQLVDSALDPSQVQVNPFRLDDDYDSLEVGDYLNIRAAMTPFRLQYKDSFVPIFKVQDRLVINIDGLEQLGFDIQFDEDTRIISIKK